MVTGEVGVSPAAIFITVPFMFGIIFVIGSGIFQNSIGVVGFGLFLSLLGWIGGYFTKIERDFIFYLIEDTLNSSSKLQ